MFSRFHEPYECTTFCVWTKKKTTFQTRFFFAPLRDFQAKGKKRCVEFLMIFAYFGKFWHFKFVFVDHRSALRPLSGLGQHQNQINDANHLKFIVFNENVFLWKLPIPGRLKSPFLVEFSLPSIDKISSVQDLTFSSQNKDNQCLKFYDKSTLAWQHNNIGKKH